MVSLPGLLPAPDLALVKGVLQPSLKQLAPTLAHATGCCSLTWLSCTYSCSYACQWVQQPSSV